MEANLLVTLVHTLIDRGEYCLKESDIVTRIETNFLLLLIVLQPLLLQQFSPNKELA